MTTHPNPQYASKKLPPQPNLEHLSKQAKDLHRAYKSGESEAIDRISRNLPRLAKANHAVIRAAKISLSEAQLVIAREYGFTDWSHLKAHVTRIVTERITSVIFYERSSQAQHRTK